MIGSTTQMLLLKLLPVLHSVAPRRSNRVFLFHQFLFKLHCFIFFLFTPPVSIQPAMALKPGSFGLIGSSLRQVDVFEERIMWFPSLPS